MEKKEIGRRHVRRTVPRKRVSKRNRAMGSREDEDRRYQMFIVSEHWLTDLKFFNDELNFLRRLVDKYFMWLVDEANIESTQKLARDLSRFETKRTRLSAKLAHHLKRLTNLIENPFSHSAQDSIDEHADLEALMSAFVKDFRRIKRAAFTLTETVIESEKSKHLLRG